MNKFKKAFHRGESGFTLIELLIVIVNLGGYSQCRRDSAKYQIHQKR